MEKKIIFETSSLYRDQFRVTGYTFGEGKKSVAIVGNTRGNEVQQLYICSQLVKTLKALEAEGKICKGHQILVLPSVNPYSVNSQKRFWPTDNTDINRMFPGYNLGETTQRIAAGVFDEVQHYTYGIQFGSFYMPGKFMPHVRMMQTGFEDVEMAKDFDMPYVVLRKVRPYETTTLNYNWQIWETKAFTIYSTTTDTIDDDSAQATIKGVLGFLEKRGIIDAGLQSKYAIEPQVVVDVDMLPIRANVAGLYMSKVKIGDHVIKGQLLAEMIDPLDGEVKEEIRAPRDGVIFFDHSGPLTYARTAVIKLL